MAGIYPSVLAVVDQVGCWVQRQRPGRLTCFSGNAILGTRSTIGLGGPVMHLLIFLALAHQPINIVVSGKTGHHSFCTLLGRI
jgi:hypothetical protein